MLYNARMRRINKELAGLIKSFTEKKIKDADFLAEMFLLFRTRRETASLLYGLLTRAERKMLATRMLIVEMLKRDVPQHEVSRKLKVGIGTVTRGAVEIQKGRFEFM